MIRLAQTGALTPRCVRSATGAALRRRGSPALAAMGIRAPPAVVAFRRGRVAAAEAGYARFGSALGFEASQYALLAAILVAILVAIMLAILVAILLVRAAARWEEPGCRVGFRV